MNSIEIVKNVPKRVEISGSPENVALYTQAARILTSASVGRFSTQNSGNYANVVSHDGADPRMVCTVAEIAIEAKRLLPEVITKPATKQAVINIFMQAVAGAIMKEREQR